MKTHSLIQQNVVQRLSRLSKLLFVAGIAAVLAVPQVDARPDRHRSGGRGGYSSHYGHGNYRPVHRPIYRPAPVIVRRGWARPGFYGAYPPVGYVNYRYIRSLPPGCRTVYRGGSRYYYSNGNYYWPARYQNSGVYLSVRF